MLNNLSMWHAEIFIISDWFLIICMGCYLDVLKNFPRVKESIHISFKICGRFNETIQAETGLNKKELRPPDKREASKSKPLPSQ